MQAHQIITDNPCPQIKSELLMVSGIDYTMRILPCPLGMVVNIDDADTTETSLLWK
jgi:hypothetical protein